MYQVVQYYLGRRKVLAEVDDEMAAKLIMAREKRLIAWDEYKALRTILKIEPKKVKVQA